MATEFRLVTPNLVVTDVERSTAFYRDVLGCSVVATVPDEPPYAFVWLKRGEVSFFLNSQAAVREHDPALADKPMGGAFTMYVLVTGIDELYAEIAPRASVIEAPQTRFYGMRECLIADPDGYLITFAEDRRNA